MILQCDQCNTRFRLDDSKLKPGGVKVRCSKCRHVFLAGADQKHEESEFDAILSGLGAQVQEKPEETAPVTQAGEPDLAEEPAPAQSDISGFAAFDFAEDIAPQGKPAPLTEEQADLGAFEVAPESGLQQEAGPDYGEFAFADEPAALKEEPPAPEETFEFGEFSFAAEPVAEMEKPAPAAPGGLDFGDFDFNPEPVVQPQGVPAPASEALEFGEFSFSEEPALRNEEPPPAAHEALDFGEFSFAEEPAPKDEKAPPAAHEALDFGEFSFAEEPAPKDEEAPPAMHEALDFGEFSFEEPAVKSGAPPAPADEAVDFDEFSFAEEPPLTRETPADDSVDFGAFSFPDNLQQQQEEETAAPVPRDLFGSGDFSFSRGFSEEEAPVAAEPSAPSGAAAPVAPEMPATPPVSPVADGQKAPGQETTLDFGFGAKPPVAPTLERGALEEELPPLSISSRRKGRSLLTVSIVALSVLVIIALTGAGLYLLQSGPAALETFDKAGLGFVAKWFGMESLEEGRITISNPQAAFHQNQEAGELFVVTGDVVNSYKKARASIHVKVSLFDNKGAVLLQKTAYCGNRLSSEQLATLPIAKIESIMNNQFGDSLSNLGVKPGQSIGCVVAIPNVPKEAVDFGVEVVGSTVAGQ